jgi:hypothetical protein
MNNADSNASTTPLAGSSPPITNAEQLLGEIDGGVFLEKIARAMSDVALGVAAFGQKGELLVKFTFNRIGESAQVECDHMIKSTAPTQRGKTIEENTTSTPLYVSGRGALSLFPIQHQEPLFKHRD